MRLPKVLLGRAGEVRRRVRRLARALVMKRSFATYDLGPLIDLNETPGLVLLGEDLCDDSELNFRVYTLSEELIAAIPKGIDIKDTMREWLLASLDVDWRFACTLGGDAVRGIRKGDTIAARAYLEAAAAFWPSIAVDRNRFVSAIDRGDILAGWHTLSLALERLGIPAIERIAAPYWTPVDWLELVKRNERSV